VILLDTNLVSEPLQPAPEAGVIEWIDAQAIETLFLSAITVAELRFGVAVLPAGKRMDRLATRLEGEILPLFADRILPFDLAASEAYAGLMSRARSRGTPIGKADGLIAAIAASRGLAVATRDTAPFLAAGLEIIDPWARR
jgi:toxin FitB